MMVPRSLFLVSVICNLLILCTTENLTDNLENFELTGKNVQNSYMTFDQMKIILNDLERKCNSICEQKIIGKTWNRNDLIVFIIGKYNTGKKVWIDGGTHAREWISPVSVLYIIEKLVTDFNTFDKYIKNTVWYIMPMVNPDGYKYSRTNNRMWRKNRRKNNRNTCYGVDLNRNFGYKWGGLGSSNNICSDNYRGTKAFSEYESIALSNFLLKNRPIDVFLTIHSYGQYILYPYGYKTGELPLDFKELHSIGMAAAVEVNRIFPKILYSVGPSYQLYPAAGASDDWAKAILEAKYTYTIELRDTGLYGFALPLNQIHDSKKDAYIISMVIVKKSYGL